MHAQNAGANETIWQWDPMPHPPTYNEMPLIGVSPRYQAGAAAEEGEGTEGAAETKKGKFKNWRKLKVAGSSASARPPRPPRV